MMAHPRMRRSHEITGRFTEKKRADYIVDRSIALEQESWKLQQEQITIADQKFTCGILGMPS